MNNLETKRTLLRQFTSSDFDSLKLMLMDNDVMKFTGFKKAQSESESKKLLAKWINDDRVWGVFNNQDNRFIGWFMLKDTISKGSPEIGFMLEKSHWNQGYATEIALKLLDYAKNELDVSKVIALTSINNLASIKVLEKIGMGQTDSEMNRDSILYYEVKLRTR